MFEDDYIMRMVKAAAAALARAVSQRQDEEHEEASESVEEGLKLLLGPNYSFIGVLDGHSLARMLPDDESRQLAKVLLQEKALHEERAGASNRARKIREQAAAF